jgi:polyribonucleotide 5'-hydroxyl-kinase
MTSESKDVVKKEWKLDPETEYRFELDPGTSLAIKVRRSSEFRGTKF